MRELKHIHAKIECFGFDTEDVRLVITERYGKQEVRMHGEDAKFIVEAIADAKRRTQPEATKPAQDLGAAILALPLPEIGGNFQQGFRTALRKAAAIASSANALSAGDRVDAVLFERLFNEYMTVLSSAYCQCDLDEELAEQCMTAIQAQKDGRLTAAPPAPTDN